MDAPGRYCLAVCYCGNCPHWQPFELTPAERARMLHTLAHPPRKYTPSWYRDPLGR
ncbi:hypothetical protein ABZX12_18520 [Kribbella sp. NPDC003505]|uniref:hypothetical protein n=1 Tax=Kribbella sp. NPDC003505 TaxID=3154448 RepID=UPI0033BE29BA